VAGLALAGRFGNLSQWSFPGHPYPPQGFYVNPFGHDKGDLVNAAEAARVKADHLADGQAELRAFESGDPSLLSVGIAGARLAKDKSLIEANSQQGVTERFESNYSSIVVGHLEDPNDSATIWCVAEKGEGRITLTAKSDGRTVSVRHFHFDGKFWLRRVSDRYLIVDALVTSS
jgi:hypothetical protein